MDHNLKINAGNELLYRLKQFYKFNPCFGRKNISVKDDFFKNRKYTVITFNDSHIDFYRSSKINCEEFKKNHLQDEIDSSIDIKYTKEKNKRIQKRNQFIEELKEYSEDFIDIDCKSITGIKFLSEDDIANKIAIKNGISIDEIKKEYGNELKLKYETNLKKILTQQITGNFGNQIEIYLRKKYYGEQINTWWYQNGPFANIYDKIYNENKLKPTRPLTKRNKKLLKAKQKFIFPILMCNKSHRT
jgi:hypothetical protein